MIMTDEPMRVADAVWLSKKVRRIVYENILVCDSGKGCRFVAVRVGLGNHVVGGVCGRRSGVHRNFKRAARAFNRKAGEEKSV